MDKEQDESYMVRVEVWTAQHLITGDLYVPLKGGYKRRLSDLLNKKDQDFLSLTDVTVATLDRQERWQAEFLALNKASVIMVKVIAE